MKDVPAFDFNTAPKTFGRDINKTPNAGYDNNYCLPSGGNIAHLAARYIYLFVLTDSKVAPYGFLKCKKMQISCSKTAYGYFGKE